MIELVDELFSFRCTYGLVYIAPPLYAPTLVKPVVETDSRMSIHSRLKLKLGRGKGNEQRLPKPKYLLCLPNSVINKHPRWVKSKYIWQLKLVNYQYHDY